MKKLHDWELEEMYELFLDEVYQPVSICGYEYEAGRALRTVDPTAFKCGCADWLDSEITEGKIEERNGEYYLAD